MQYLRFNPKCDITQIIPAILKNPARLLCSWDFPGKNTRVGCHSLLQGIFPIQGSNLGLPYYRRILYPLNHQGSLQHKE